MSNFPLLHEMYDLTMNELVIHQMHAGPPSLAVCLSVSRRNTFNPCLPQYMFVWTNVVSFSVYELGLLTLIFPILR